MSLAWMASAGPLDSYVVEAGQAVAVWDRRHAARSEFGLEPFGYRALDALRMEKGYRYFGTDVTMLETPFEAGLGAFVRLGKGPFIGRDALVAARDADPEAPARRLRTVLIGGLFCVAGAIVFHRTLPALRKLVEPIYILRGILPEVAVGIRDADTATQNVAG